MDNVKKEITKTKITSQKPTKTNKKEYKKPKITNYGKLKDLTLGGSPGISDSGNPDTQDLP